MSFLLTVQGSGEHSMQKSLKEIKEFVQFNVGIYRRWTLEYNSELHGVKILFRIQETLSQEISQFTFPCPRLSALESSVWSQGNSPNLHTSLISI